jgi:hypothetical protein
MIPFVGHPGSCLFVAIFLLVVVAGRFWATGGFAWQAVIAAGVWLGFAAWEHYCRVGGYNIRADLIFVLPVVTIFTVWGLTGIAHASGPRRP